MHSDAKRNPDPVRIRYSYIPIKSQRAHPHPSSSSPHRPLARYVNNSSRRARGQRIYVAAICIFSVCRSNARGLQIHFCCFMSGSLLAVRRYRCFAGSLQSRYTRSHMVHADPGSANMPVSPSSPCLPRHPAAGWAQILGHHETRASIGHQSCMQTRKAKFRVS